MLNRARKGHIEPVGVRRETFEDSWVQGHALGQGDAAAGERLLARQADRGDAGARRVAAGLGEPASLAEEGGPAAKGVRVPDLHGDRGVGTLP